MSNFLKNCILIYQKTLSMDHGIFKQVFPYGFCRHYPSCSEYTYLSIHRFGSIKGIILGMKRISKCTPFHEPSIDLVPDKKHN